MATASYDPVTMASGATDLINEAATSKITGEEERYSNTDFIVFQANVDAAMEVVDLLKPYLAEDQPADARPRSQHEYQAVESAIAKYKATPGYDDTGYVEYSTVLDPQRRQLSAVVQAFAESLSKISGKVDLSGCPLGARALPPPAPRWTGPRRAGGRAGPPAGARRRRCRAVPRRRAGRGRGGGHRGRPDLPLLRRRQAGIVTPAQDRLAFATLNLVRGHDAERPARPAAGLDHRRRPHDAGPTGGRGHRPERAPSRYG